MKGVIFDLDGTLTDTLDSLVYSVNATLTQMNLPEITREQCEAFVGNGARVLMEKAVTVSGEEHLARIEEAMRWYGSIFDQNCTYHVTPYKGIEEMLHTLKKQGVRLGILSNKPHHQTIKVAREIFGAEVFDVVQGQCQEIPRKPSPEGIYHIIAQWGLEKKDVLYVGDSEVDMETGNRAGVETVGVTWGFRSRDTLLSAGARMLVDKPEELLCIAGKEDEEE